MTEAYEDLLASQFAALKNGLDNSDWAEVLSRARQARRRRMSRMSRGVSAQGLGADRWSPGRRAWFALAVLLAAVLVFVVAPALGIGPPALDFFAAKHAPKKVVLQFEQLNVGSPNQMSPQAIAGETRLVTTYHLRNGRSIPLWVAPTRKGGFCFTVIGGGCATRHVRVPSEPGDLNTGALGLGIAGAFGSTVLSGYVFNKQIAEIEVRFKHAAPVQVPLLWVGRPIDAGFYFYELTPVQRRTHETKAVVALDAHGNVLARVASIFRPAPAWSNPRKVAELSKKHVILRSGQAAIAIAPSRAGGNCFWVSVGRSSISGGCAPPRFQTQPMAGGLGHGPEFTVFSGQVKPDVSRVELRFQDGTRQELQPVQGFILYTIPPRHWPRGHRLTAVIAYSPTGKQLAREAFHPRDIGLYPCTKPIPIGAGLTTCP